MCSIYIHECICMCLYVSLKSSQQFSGTTYVQTMELLRGFLGPEPCRLLLILAWGGGGSHMPSICGKRWEFCGTWLGPAWGLHCCANGWSVLGRNSCGGVQTSSRLPAGLPQDWGCLPLCLQPINALIVPSSVATLRTPNRPTTLP